MSSLTVAAAVAATVSAAAAGTVAALPSHPPSSLGVSSPFDSMQPRITWTLEVCGRFHALLASMRQKAPTPNTRWKHDEMMEAYEKQIEARNKLASSAASASSSSSSSSSMPEKLTERYAYRSEMLLDADRIFALLIDFHSCHSAVPQSDGAGASSSIDGSFNSAAATQASNQLLTAAVQFRATFAALVTIAHSLLHIYEGLFQR